MMTYTEMEKKMKTGNIYDYTLYPEKVRNYEQAMKSKEKWELHHIMECPCFNGEGRWLSKLELKLRGEYYNISPDKLIWLPKKVHAKLHTTRNPHGWAAKGYMTEERKKQVSVFTKIAMANLPPDKRAKMSYWTKETSVCKGRHYYNDGIKTYMLFDDDPKIKQLSLIRGQSEETKQRMTSGSRGKKFHYITVNGKRK